VTQTQRLRRSDELRRRLSDDSVIRAPGVHDGISTRIAEELGFDGLYVSGAATAACLGYPDMGITTADELVAAVRTVRSCAPDLLTVVDVDTGYGGLLQLRRLAEDLAALDVAAIHIEDQGVSRRCGFMTPDCFVEASEMRARIRAAGQQPGGPVVIARSDALPHEGLGATLDRVRAYEQAGAEMIMVNGITAIQELEALAKVAQLPILYNVSGSDRAPDLTDDVARELGVKVVIYPVFAARAAGAGTRALLTAIRNGTDRGAVPMLAFDEYFRLAGWLGAERFENAMRDDAEAAK
jgi:2-methylisocitrate lyase-like PEP mutase family enzyme